MKIQWFFFLNKLSENTGIRIKCSRNLNEFVEAKVGSNFCSKEDAGT